MAQVFTLATPAHNDMGIKKYRCISYVESVAGRDKVLRQQVLRGEMASV